jgi:hypothetical protein
MLQIAVPLTPEYWNEKKREFIPAETVTLQLEHSLLSISIWESKWCKSFIASSKKLTDEEILDYIKCMTLNKNVHPDVYKHLTPFNIKEIEKYISAPMTATYFSENKNAKTSRETVTSELIYYWMIALNIPFECQKWHLNRLLTLVRVCNIKNQPPKKMSKKDIMSRNAALNAARRKQFNTKG